MFCRNYVSGLGCNLNVRLLSWEAGGNPADGVWAPYWYQNVHRSTGFAPYRPKSEPFPEELESLLAVCLEYYGTLSENAIRA